MLRVTCQWSPLCVFMCLFGADLRVIPLVFVGKNRGGFYGVFCERKYVIFTSLYFCYGLTMSVIFHVCIKMQAYA